MKKRKLGKSNLEVSGDRLRLHGNELRLRSGGEKQERIALIRPPSNSA